MRRAILAAVGMIVVVAGVNAAGLSEAEKSRIKGEIEAEVQKIAVAAKAVDIERATASSSLSPDYRAIDNGTVYASRDALLAVFREGFRRLQSQDIRVIDQDTVVLAPDVAVYTGRGTFTATDKSGTTSPVTPFAWTIVWRRESGAWKVLNLHQSFGRSAAQ